ncbi:MAG: efflux RND transporter permease subunit [Acidobacteriota bacterium]
MAHLKSDDEMIKKTHNTARFFVETRHISWVLLIATCIWGIYGYFNMPQRKDPDIPVRVAVALTPWPGSSAEKIENLVTKRIEAKIAENAKVTKIESISRTSISVVYLELDENIKETGKELDDIKLKLDSITDLPDGAGPINFIKDFGDTAALMLTVASPKVNEVEIALRSDAVQKAISETRAQASTATNNNRFTIIQNVPPSFSLSTIRAALDLLVRFAKEKGFAEDIRLIETAGFVGLDGASSESEEKLQEYTQQFIREKLQAAEFDPDVWQSVVIKDPQETRAKITAIVGEKYSYRQMDDFTDIIEKTLKTIPAVSKVSRSGILQEKVFLEYSQERLAAYNLESQSLQNILKARNITLPGGQLQVDDKNLTIDPSGEFKSEKEIADVVVGASASGVPVYLRDLVDIVRSYDNPPRFLNFYNWRDANGDWQRTRAITLSVQMRAGEKIGDFGKTVDETLNELKKRLPEDLILARTSDQPLQVTESVDLFMTSLYEAIVLVVLVSLVGFWEWRSALLMAFSIPITLAMTFGLMSFLGIDLQQISIGTLIIALGLLVDDPVVAGDAIKRDLASGHTPLVSAWLGPTKLATAIMYATVTNIVAYLPFLLLTGDTGKFLYSLPVVLACSLVASRLVSMTFIPLLGFYLLKPKAERPIEERRKKGFAAFYYRIGTWAIQHRWKVLAGSLAFLALGGFFLSQLKQQFFPKDLSYLSYVDVWLPEDAPLFATNEAARQAEETIRDVVKEYELELAAKTGESRPALESLTTFVGGGGPRFWFSLSPEQQQLNYAQIIIQTKDKHDTNHLIAPLQKALSARVAGARIDVRQLESGAAVGLPVAIRLSGDDIGTLRAYAEQLKEILRAVPTAARVRDDWGDESFMVKLQTDADRANMAGVSNMDVASSSVAGMTGASMTTLREGDKQIPVVVRMRMEERAQLGDIKNLYVYSQTNGRRIPLQQVSSIDYQLETEKLRRRNQFRTITVSCMPEGDTLPSEIMTAARPQLEELQKQLPPGYKLEIGGEEAEQVKGFKQLTIVMAISVAVIFLALVFQFKHAIKPFIVFAAIPYGIVGALGVLWMMGAPFGFMAFLGIVSLIGVIVSHIIVLFDFIEEKHAEGEPLIEALLDAGIMRLRPVLITVGATVIALFPLAAHGGPLWEPLCYAQIGGLCAATVVTLLMVPVIYSIFVLDLKLVKWDSTPEPSNQEVSDVEVVAITN